MEYLIVTLREDDGAERCRRVKIDDEFLGCTTEHFFELERGTHVVSLGPPYNFTPREQTIRLTNTNPITPRVVRFDVV